MGTGNVEEDKPNKSMSKKRKKHDIEHIDLCKDALVNTEDGRNKKRRDKSQKKRKKSKMEPPSIETCDPNTVTGNNLDSEKDVDRRNKKRRDKSQKKKKKNKKEPPSRETCDLHTVTGNNLDLEKDVEKGTDVSEAHAVYQIPLVDEDSSKGMKKWIMEYYRKRPGLKILQQRVDDFITSYEEQKEEIKESEAQQSEEGWTAVVRNKGRKKSKDLVSGVAVGSVAPAAVMEKLAKKKKDEHSNLYQFHKKEARRNEIQMLQNKFDEDRKRIQHIRAARKFRPY